MAAKIEFTATHDGTTETRTSGTMPYVAAVFGVGVTWHKSIAAAHKAAKSGQHIHNNPAGGVVVPAIPTAIVGKLGDWTPEVDGWGDIPASAFTELVAAKKAGNGKKASAPVAAEVEAPAEVADDSEWEYEAPETSNGAVVETVGTIKGGVVTVEVTVPKSVEPEVKPEEPTIKLRITRRVSDYLVTVERDVIVASIIAKIAGSKKRADGSVTIATTAEERDMLVVHCTAMETANLEGAGFHNLDRLNKVNAARWLVARITEAEAAAQVA